MCIDRVAAIRSYAEMIEGNGTKNKLGLSAKILHYVILDHTRLENKFDIIESIFSICIMKVLYHHSPCQI